MKIGDLVRCTPDVYGDDNASGVVIGWAKTGGTDPTVWEVLWEDGKIDLALENELEVLSESR